MRRVGAVARHLAGARVPARAISTLLVANRGEVAVRILRAAKELGMATVAVFEQDDAGALHTTLADQAFECGYMDVDALVDVARQSRADGVHPGWGFLSERPEFAEALQRAGIAFVGPSSEHLALFGDKLEARRVAAENGVPVLAGSTEEFRDARDVLAFVRAKGMRFPLMLKDQWGGGGRGVVRVESEAHVQQSLDTMKEQAGFRGVFVEELMQDAMHVEVQVVSDGTKAFHLFDRDCSLQNERHQKMVELAPAARVPQGVRRQLWRHAEELAASVGFRGVCTVEFLVSQDGNRFVFLEVNPRLQVEHTVTEEITGVDLVHTQLLLAQGRPLGFLGEERREHGFAIQGRLCLTRGGQVTRLSEPTGKGTRVDSMLRVGATPSVRFDPLLSKLVVSGSDWATTWHRFVRGLGDFDVEGIDTNVTELEAIASHPRFRAWGEPRGATAPFATTFVQDEAAALGVLQEEAASRRAAAGRGSMAQQKDAQQAGRPRRTPAPENVRVVAAPNVSNVSEIRVGEGDVVREGEVVMVLTAMKMDTMIRAPMRGVVVKLCAKAGHLAEEGEDLFWIEPTSSDSCAGASQSVSFQEQEREREMARAAEERQRLMDAREQAQAMGGEAQVAKQHAKGRLTIRERINLLLDGPESFREAGRAAAGNFVLGRGKVNGRPIVVGGEDFTISGGSPNPSGLRKSIFTETLALQLRVPLVRLHEGGGGAVGGTSTSSSKGKQSSSGGSAKPVGDPAFSTPRFQSVAHVLGMVPVACAALGPVAGLPASRLVASHFSVMCEHAQVLIAGPQVVQRALGYETTKEELGGHQVHAKSGVVDNVVATEAEAIAQCRRFLSFMPTNVFEVAPVEPCEDPTDRQDAELDTLVSLLHRRDVYDMREVLQRVMDLGSVFEVAKEFGTGIITAYARLDGKPVGVIANDCSMHGGAMTDKGARKTKRFMEICETFSLPIVFFVDEPGFDIGLESERAGTIRSGTAAVLTASTLTVPCVSVVVRKVYGVAGAAHFAPGGVTLLWPSAEIGALPVESGVAVAFKRKLDAIADDAERERTRKELERGFYAKLSPFPRAASFSAHDLILPSETRPVLCDWIETAWPLVHHLVADKRTALPRFTFKP